MAAVKVKYGNSGKMAEPVFSIDGAFNSSITFKAKSGRFVVYGTSAGYWVQAPDNSTLIGGYIEFVGTTPSTAGGKLPVAQNVNLCAFELPYAVAGAAGTLTEAVGKTLLGKKIDLYVDGNGIQYADNAASQAILEVVGYDVDENTLYVRVIDSAIGQAAI